MKTFQVTVTQDVIVMLDETMFTEEFSAHFRKHFFDFHSLDDHAEHIAHLVVREMIRHPEDFAEGYGPLDKMNIHFCRHEMETESFEIEGEDLTDADW